MSVINNPQAEELIEAFELFGDWEQRYQFIIDLGKKLVLLREDEKIEANRVHGCQATVWLVADVNGDVMEFRAESDAAIVNGLIAILQRLYSGSTAEQVFSFEIKQFLGELGLEEHLSPTRRNGLHEMVKRIRAFARASQN